MTSGVDMQRAATADICSNRDDWSFHVTSDPLTRFLRDRRLRVALRMLRVRGLLDPAGQSVLIVCGGVGGEGVFLSRCGFTDVTVSDLSEEALGVCRTLDPKIRTMPLNAENMAEIPDSSYDLVLVQDGLHHLPRPVLGFTEMLRVARKAVIVIEPHDGLVGRLIGTEWERQGEFVNYVFRWNRSLLNQATRSYLLCPQAVVLLRRLWDHNLAVGKVAGRFPERWRLTAAKAVYQALRPVNRLGNMMVAVVVKSDGDPTPRSGQ
ncbi:class I SAM-dependent methyltransferase [Streptomyces coeruleorubidus]|uniref:class I SAM-dependent methyltransferase n=1 Tax=Streptomyces coeruleorubidus TaxID=116188 RepID=UPI00381B882A